MCRNIVTLKLQSSQKSTPITYKGKKRRKRRKEGKRNLAFEVSQGKINSRSFYLKINQVCGVFNISELKQNEKNRLGFKKSS